MVLKRLKKITGMDKGNKVSKLEDVPDWAKDKVEQATARQAESNGPAPSAPPPPPAASEPSISPMGEATAQVDTVGAEAAGAAETAAAEAAAAEAAAAEAAAAEAAAAEAAAAQAASAPQPVTYTVVSGDTLSGIAQRFYGDASAYMRIFEANRDKLNDPNLIHPGQELVIPQ
jgi:LysM repeat protein